MLPSVNVILDVGVMVGFERFPAVYTWYPPSLLALLGKYGVELKVSTYYSTTTEASDDSESG